MFLIIITLIAGLFLLVYSAGYLVNGASSLAKRFGISPMVIGLTVVAFGTSAPELVVNLVSVARGETGIAVGNVLGSNLVNILLVLGGAAALRTITMHHITVWRGIPLLFASSLLLFIFSSDVLINRAPGNILSRLDGIVLLICFALFLYYTATTVRDGGMEPLLKKRSLWLSVLMTIGGIAGLTIGGDLIVDNAIKIASWLGVSSTFMGLTVIALGTSLPELATSIVAGRKGENDIAVGNVIGSNMFNTLFILGLSAVIHPLPISAANRFDTAVVAMVTALFFGAMFIGRKRTLERWQGLLFVGFYLAYVVYLVRLYAA